MERIYAFTDESGAFGWDLDNTDVSTHFVITAIIVKESDLDSLRTSVEIIRKKHFQTGEMKSASIGRNHERRKRILAEFITLPLAIFTIVVDKQQLLENKGLRYKPSFYKFLNNIVHKELKRAYSVLTIVADEIGGSDYMQSFSDYVRNKQDIPTLLREADFRFENSRNDVLLQAADLFAGTFAYEYDKQKRLTKPPQFHKIFERKIARTELYPKSYKSYILETSAIAENYDTDIAKLCFRQAVTFIEQHEDDEEPERKAQVIVLKHLLFRFMNNDLRGYIPTRELINQLSSTDYHDITTQTFRTRIIGKMRDDGVIISGSSPKKGYKIPSCSSELYDFINHGTSIIIPMLERLKKCRDLVKLGSINELDLFEHTEYISLKRFFDV